MLFFDKNLKEFKKCSKILLHLLLRFFPVVSKIFSKVYPSTLIKELDSHRLFSRHVDTISDIVLYVQCENQKTYIIFSILTLSRNLRLKISDKRNFNNLQEFFDLHFTIHCLLLI